MKSNGQCDYQVDISCFIGWTKSELESYGSPERQPNITPGVRN